MTDVLDDIRFLADSDHRAVVLDELADGPRSRSELREATGASSATIGRIVQSFADRGWLERDGPSYSLTALGSFVAASFATHRADMQLARELDELLPYIPVRDIGIDVTTLSDARITRATQADPFAVVSRVRELELTSDDAASLTDFFPEPCIDGRYNAIVDGTQTFEAVFAPVVVESAMASRSASKFEAIVASDRTDVYVYGETISHPVMLHDGVGCLVVRDDDNVSIGMVELADETFVEWVVDVFESHRADATLLTPENLTVPMADVLAEV
ncbi:helix-turn-helix transcriptional regulator [Haloferax sp. YSSS75]|uniref:helix-turn-helix transcriptional regulator n=1 Tax=Haloferax sp. YSSS75 TaxID=3388564 RepID=UPI00398CA256